MGEVILDYTMNGRVTEPQGNQHRSHAPHNVYPCQGDDRWIAIDVATQEQWDSLCSIMGGPEWAMDSKFADPVSRWNHQKELDEHISEWSRDKNDFELFHAMQKAGITAGPVQNEADAYNCPQLDEIGFFEELTGPETGTHSYPGLNFSMSKTSNELRRHPVRLGEDNEYIYKELLGLSDEEYVHLEELGQIGMDYPAHIP